LSTDGAGHVPVDFLQTLRGQSVVVAYDNDAAGQEMAKRVMDLLPNAVRKQPNAKDWNEDLKNMFDFALEQEKVLEQQQHNQERHRGFSR
jgi:DNA primase